MNVAPSTRSWNCCPQRARLCGAEQRNEAILLRAAPRGKQKSKQVVIVFGRRRTDNGAEEEEEEEEEGEKEGRENDRETALSDMRQRSA